MSGCPRQVYSERGNVDRPLAQNLDNVRVDEGPLLFCDSYGVLKWLQYPCFMVRGLQRYERAVGIQGALQRGEVDSSL